MHRQCGIQFKELSEAGELEGYASVFSVEDGDGDIVVPGAFAESVAEHRLNGTRPKMLWGHAHRDRPVGVWEEFEEDNRGLKVRGRLLLDTQAGADTYAVLKAGAADSMSIGFRIKEGGIEFRDDKVYLTKLDLREVSFVNNPANEQAKITQIKSAEDIYSARGLEAWLRDEQGLAVREARRRASKAAAILTGRDDLVAGEELVESIKSLDRLFQS